MKKSALIILLLCGQLTVKAQFERGFQVNFLPGFLIAHREYMANMEAHTYGVELIYSSNFTAWKAIDSTYKNLRWGTGLTYFNLGNRDVNGSVYAWHMHVEANLKKRKNFQATLRFGSGVGFITKPYNLETNRQNRAIGSHLNGNMQVMYKAYFKVSPRNSLALGLGMTHYSNGNFKRPNLGINMAHLNLGLYRVIKTVDNPRFIPLKKPFPDNGFEIVAGVADKQIAVADTRRFTIYSASLLYYFKHNSMRNWRVGPEYFYDRTYPYQLFQPASLKHVPLAKKSEIAMKVGHEFVFGRIAIVTDIGTYVYRPNKYKKAVYFAIGFNYYFNKGILAQSRLKSHMAVADYFYWGTGYRFSDKFLRKK